MMRVATRVAMLFVHQSRKESAMRSRRCSTGATPSRRLGENELDPAAELSRTPECLEVVES